MSPGSTQVPSGESPATSRADALSHLTTQRPVAVLMIFVAAMVFGIFSYRLLPLTLMPELAYPTLTVRTEYPGSAPEEVENDISRPVEEALGVIGGLQRLSSDPEWLTPTSHHGSSSHSDPDSPNRFWPCSWR